MKNASKSKKKLSLNKETLRKLSDESLRNVNGGADTDVTCFYCTGHCPSWPKGCRPIME